MRFSQVILTLLAPLLLSATALPGSKDNDDGNTGCASWCNSNGFPSSGCVQPARSHQGPCFDCGPQWHGRKHKTRDGNKHMQLCHQKCCDWNSDNDNCGKCDKKCTGGQVCNNGNCECQRGWTKCADGNCKKSCAPTCSPACGTGQTCQLVNNMPACKCNTGTMCPNGQCMTTCPPVCSPVCGANAACQLVNNVPTCQCNTGYNKCTDGSCQMTCPTVCNPPCGLNANCVNPDSSGQGQCQCPSNIPVRCSDGSCRVYSCGCPGAIPC